jgi:hypothetical protein
MLRSSNISWIKILIVEHVTVSTDTLNKYERVRFSSMHSWQIYMKILNLLRVIPFFKYFFTKDFFLACVKPHRKWKLPWKWTFFVITIFLLCWVEVHGNNLLKNKTNFLAKHGWFSFLNFLLCWWEYITAFTKLLTIVQIYHTWIHPRNILW